MQSLCLRSVLAFCVTIAVSKAIFSAELPIDSSEQKVLDKWVGRWHATYKVSKAEWTPEERTGTAELTTDRVVGGRFVQEKAEHSDKTSASLIFTYDVQRKKYRNWWFSSKGYTSEGTGEWDAVTNTMTMTSKQDGNTTTTTWNGSCWSRMTPVRFSSVWTGKASVWLSRKTKTCVQNKALHLEWWLGASSECENRWPSASYG